jgi:heat shock protein HspQ
MDFEADKTTIRLPVPRLLLTERGAKITSWGMKERQAKYAIGDIVRHRVYSFRGVIFDVDPTFSNSEEWYNSIPEEVRPTKDQPFYHLFAENAETEYVAYVSEQNLLPDTSNEPVRHPQIAEVFDIDEKGRYKARTLYMN